jgi:predicted  nucleic acid-binding Zn-ribbon protein
MYREFNENPQVSLLKEEVKRLEEELKKQKNEFERYESRILVLREEFYLYQRQKEKEFDHWERWKEEYKADRARMEEEMKNFNTLPWFKKMRYKFHIE